MTAGARIFVGSTVLSVKLCLLVILMVVLCPFQTHAEPTISSKTQYYSIEGRDARTLRNQMTAKGPKGIGSNSKRRFWAHTRWYVDWRFRYASRGSGCAITNVEVRVRTLFEMPRWKNAKGASAQLKQKWQTFYKNLDAHEKQHARHGIDAGHAVERAIKNMTDDKGCSSLYKRANDVASNTVGKYAQKDIDFDKATKHGATSGVALK